MDQGTLRSCEYVSAPLHTLPVGLASLSRPWGVYIPSYNNSALLTDDTGHGKIVLTAQSSAQTHSRPP